MNHPMTFDGFHFEGLDVAILRQPCIDRNIPPCIRSSGRHYDVAWHPHDQVWLADAPPVVVLELARRRHIGGIPLGRTIVHPLRDGGDLRVGEGHTVLELLDTNIPVDMPWR